MQAMNSTFNEGPKEPETCGEAAFVTDQERAARIADLRASNVLVVEVAPDASDRGKLEEAVGDAVDAELEARGGGSLGVTAAFDREGATNDRIFRARRLGFVGLAIAMGSLASTQAGRSSLDAEDCAAMKKLAEMTTDRPLYILFDKRDRDLGAHARPIPFAALFSTPPARRISTAPSQLTLASAGIARTPTPSLPPAMPTVAVSKPLPAIAPRVRELAPKALPPLAREAITAGASIATEDDEWRGWMLALSAARGPQSLATFERLFVEAYLPLWGALASGLDDPRAKASLLVFRRAFESTYPEAAARFPLTDKRPKMVLDVPELAMKLARAHGARMSQIFVLEAMRFDVGIYVREALVRALGDHADLVEDTRLHAALPTTTPRALETIARGRDALRAPAATSEDMMLAARSHAGLHRLRIGGREIFKLDTIELGMDEDPSCTPPRFGALADSVAETIASHVAALRVKTLIYLTGDRGFTLDANGNAKCGGATPEEVIVPAFAFLISP